LSQEQIFNYLLELRTKKVDDFFSVQQIFLALNTRGFDLNIASTRTGVRRLYAWGYLDVKPLKIKTGGFLLVYRITERELLKALNPETKA